jgi:hypothetical protein
MQQRRNQDTMRIKTRKNVCILWLSLLITGCVASKDLPVRVVPTVVEAWTPAQEMTTTKSSLAATQSATPTMSLSSTEKHRCPIVQDEVPTGFLRSGKIIFIPNEFDSTSDHPDSTNLRFIDPVTFSPQPFLESMDCCLYIFSPDRKISWDRKWAAFDYENTEKKQFGYVVTNANNASMFSLLSNSLSYPWQGLLTWLNDGRLVLYPKSDSSQYPNTLLIYHPVTKEQTEFKLHLPGILSPEKEHELWDWYNAIYPSIDPTMTRAVYYKWEDLSSIHREIVLWDIDKNMALWSYALDTPLYEFELSEPMWSSDGSWFVLVIRDQIDLKRVIFLRVFRDGRQEILNAGVLNQPLNTIAGVSVSPNYRYISFFVFEEGKHHLYILDLVKNKVWDTCLIDPYPANAPIFMHMPGIWSPDSQQIIVSTNIDISSMETANEETRFIVDIETKEIVRFDSISNRWAIWLAP